MRSKLIGNKLLFEEFITNRYDEQGNIIEGDKGACLDLIEFEEWGYNHTKFYVPSTDEKYIEELLHHCSGVDRDEVNYIKSEELNIRKYDFNQPIMYKSDSSSELMKQLYEIEKLGDLKVAGQSNGEFMVYYYFSSLIYEVNNMSVKIPIKSIGPSGDSGWSYEYLIFPNFTVNEEVLVKVRKISKNEGIKLNISGIDMDKNNKRGISRSFSTSLHNFLQRNFIMECNKAKGIVNAIRLREHYLVIDNDFYEIHQNSRISKKDSISYSGYVYSGDSGLENEPGFKDYLEIMGTNIKQITEIANNKPLFEDYINENKDNILYEPIITYMTNLDNPFEAMEEYENVERNRNYLRKLRYQINMILYDGMRDFLSYIDLYQPGLNYSQDKLPISLIEKIYWERGEFQEGYKKKSYKPRSKKVREF